MVSPDALFWVEMRILLWCMAHRTAYMTLAAYLNSPLAICYLGANILDGAQIGVIGSSKSLLIFVRHDLDSAQQVSVNNSMPAVHFLHKTSPQGKLIDSQIASEARYEFVHKWCAEHIQSFDLDQRWIPLSAVLCNRLVAKPKLDRIVTIEGFYDCEAVENMAASVNLLAIKLETLLREPPSSIPWFSKTPDWSLWTPCGYLRAGEIYTLFCST